MSSLSSYEGQRSLELCAGDPEEESFPQITNCCPFLSLGLTLLSPTSRLEALRCCGSVL